MQLTFTSHFSSCNSLIYLLGIHASELCLVDRHPMKGHVLHSTRTQFHGCLDSACTLTWVIEFPKAYGCFCLSPITTKWMVMSQKSCLYVFQSELCFGVFWLSHSEICITEQACLASSDSPVFQWHGGSLNLSYVTFCCFFFQLSIISLCISSEFKTSVLLNFPWTLLEIFKSP